MNVCTILVSAALMVPVGVIAQPTPGAPFASAHMIVSLATDEGVIKSVDLEARSFVLAIGSDDAIRDLTVKVSDKTAFTLNGQESSMERALAAGHKAKVTHVDGKASSVDVTTSREP